MIDLWFALFSEYNKFILSEKQGAAFVVYPMSGQLQPFGESIIEITAHSDMWGEYKDSLIFKVSEIFNHSFFLMM